ncbi:MAG: DUF2164 domain-containing protein [Proteobacteria bacterium]|nr:DUF2164 domain-containing protein [Pseudomonadota bacterium]
MRIRLTDERRERLLHSIRRFLAEEFDEEVGDLKAGRLLDFFTVELGAPIYNQAIRDAHGFITEKLVDLEGEFYEPEEPYRA